MFGEILVQLLKCDSLTMQTKYRLYLVLDFINGGHLFFQLYKQGLFRYLAFLADSFVYQKEVARALKLLWFYITGRSLHESIQLKLYLL
jgi:hypothetical protein